MKAYVKDFVIKMKLSDFISLQTTGKLVGVHKPIPKEAAPRLVTPEEHEFVRQVYIPESLIGTDVPADKMYSRDDCESAVVITDKMTDKTTITVLPKDVVKEIKESELPKNIMNVTVHNRDEADLMMFPMKDAQSFVFYPDTKDPDNVQNYMLMLGVLNNSDLAFCSIVNLQNHEGLFRLSVWRGRIVLVKQGFPDSINEHELPASDEFEIASLPESVITKAVNGFKKLAEPINVETYRNRIVQEQIALKESVESGEVIPVKAEKAKPVATDLESLLSVFDD